MASLLADMTDKTPLLRDISPFSEAITEKTAPGETQTHTYSVFVALCFAINYNVGAGVLALPEQFSKAGFIQAPLLMGAVCFVAYITFQWLLETMVRAEALTSISRRLGIAEDTIHRSPADLTHRLQIADVPIEELADELHSPDKILVRNEYEMNELVYMFLGRRWGYLYDAFWAFGIWCVLWSYAVLVAASATRFLGIAGIHTACDITTNASAGCTGVYWIYSLMFWVWAVFISTRDFSEQAGLQVSMTALRVFVIGIMSVTSVGLLFSSLVYSKTTGKYSNSPGSADQVNGVQAFNGWYTPSFLVVAWFAVASQGCVPDVIGPMRGKKNSSKVMLVMLIACFVLYLVLGLTTSLYFGKDSEAPCTLAWESFQGFSTSPGNVELFIAKIISGLVVIFPIADISSAFPLNAITLSNNLMHSLFPPDVAHERLYQVFFRIFLCTTSIGAAMLFTNLDMILTITGMFMLVANGVVPFLLQKYSQNMCKTIVSDAHGVDDLGRVQTTPFSSKMGNVHIMGPIVVLFAAVCIVSVLSQLIAQLSP